MPAKSEKQRQFMGAELQRKREGKSTVTDMTEEQLRDFAKKPIKKSEKIAETLSEKKIREYAKKSLSDKINSFVVKMRR